MLINDFVENFSKNIRPKGWKDCTKQSEEWRIHTCGSDISPVLIDYRVNESIEAKEERARYGRKVTYAVFNQFFDQVKTIMADNLVAYNIPDKLKIAIEKQVSPNPINFYRNTGLRRMFDDPNGYVVVLPYKTSISTTEALPLKLAFIPYESVHVSEETVICFKYRDMYYIIDNDYYYRFDEDNIIDDSYTYQHGLGRLPAVQLKGYEATNPEDEDKTTVYSSFTAGAFEFAALSLRSLTDEARLGAIAAHPITEITSMPCDNRSCIDGKIPVLGENGGRTFETCRNCNGTGYKTITLSMGDTIIKQKDDLSPEKEPSGGNTINYYQPPMEGLRYHQEAWQKYYDQYRESLYIVFVNAQQSGVSKQEDRKRMSATIDTIARTVYENIEYLYNVAYELLYPLEDVIDIKLELPLTFHDVSVQGLFLQINELKSSGAPQGMISAAVKKMGNQLYHKDKREARIIELSLALDPLYSKGDADIQALLQLQVITAKTAQRHYVLWYALSRLADELGDAFYDLDLADVEVAIQPLIDDFINENAPPPPPQF